MTNFNIGSEDFELYSMTDGIVRPDRNIPLDDVNKLSSQDPIWANRGKAIHAYATLEQSLCSLFIHAGDLKHEVGNIVFFKITSAKARNSILEKLIRLKHGDKFNLFWNSYLKQLTAIDNKRNEIVHWTSATSVYQDAQNVIFVGVSFVPPAHWIKSMGETRILSKDLAAFATQCDVFSRLCNMFISVGHLTEEQARPWLDILQRPLVYPLPEGHPLYGSPPKPDNPPQPSPK